MLNRTNRTLSANLNRLNLGTRSLAATADALNGNQTLRIRHVHRVVLRDRIYGYRLEPMGISSPEMPSISDPRFVPPFPVPGHVQVRPRVEFAAAATVAVAGAANDCWRKAAADETFLELAKARPDHSKRERASQKDEASQGRQVVRLLAARTVPGPIAAIHAALGG